MFFVESVFPFDYIYIIHYFLGKIKVIRLMTCRNPGETGDVWKL